MINKLEEEVKRLKDTDETLFDKSQEALDVQDAQDDKENNSVDIIAQTESIEDPKENLQQVPDKEIDISSENDSRHYKLRLQNKDIV